MHQFHAPFTGSAEWSLCRFSQGCIITMCEFEFARGTGTPWARTIENQRIEAAINYAVLNRMTGLGMPRTLGVV